MPSDDGWNNEVPLIAMPLKAHKGRGAVSNLQGRYELQARERFDDGWMPDEEDSADGDNPPKRKTQIIDEHAKTILTRNTSPDLPFNVSLNPYRVITPTYPYILPLPI